MERVGQGRNDYTKGGVSMSKCCNNKKRKPRGKLFEQWKQNMGRECEIENTGTTRQTRKSGRPICRHRSQMFSIRIDRKSTGLQEPCRSCDRHNVLRHYLQQRSDCGTRKEAECSSFFLTPAMTSESFPQGSHLGVRELSESATTAKAAVEAASMTGQFEWKGRTRTSRGSKNRRTSC